MNVSPVKYTKILSLRLTEEDYEFIKNSTQEENLISYSDFIRKSIEEKKQQKQIEKQLQLKF